MTTCPPELYDAAALEDRLTTGTKRSGRPVVFLLGSAITAPSSIFPAGVPNAEGVIAIIGEEFQQGGLQEFSAALDGSSNRYQAAFSYLIGRRGQQAANDVIKAAVWMARRKAKGLDSGQFYSVSSNTDDATCRSFETEYAFWSLGPAVSAIGKLAAQYPSHFGQTILTTNFDPLIGVAIGVAGGNWFRTVLHRDGNLGQTSGAGSHIIHLHGYWYGADTLHTPRQLTQSRPRLKASISHLLQGRTLVVSGYSGWDDIFIETLLETVIDDLSFPEVAWAFYDATSDHAQRLIDELGPGIDRGRITLYDRIDCHEFFPRLITRWNELEPPILHPSPRVTSILAQRVAIPIEPLPTEEVSAQERLDFAIGGQDLPPAIDFYVGRDDDSALLADSDFLIGVITGIGGQGKSALAAKFFAQSEVSGSFNYCIWRDCKEESDRFEAKLASIIHVLSAGSSLAELSEASAPELADLLIDLSTDLSLLIVFDNVDSYIDLENSVFLDPIAGFIDQFLKRPSRVKVIFTCRPEVEISHPSSVHLHLEGLDLSATRDLFHLRGLKESDEAVERAHGLTSGHAFWLDLMAIQAGTREPPVSLDYILDSVDPAEASLPTSTLRSIWETLKEREQIVLRGLAESVRPMNESELADILRGKIQFNQLTKAVRALKALNLVVTKTHREHRDVLELHPLVKAFIRSSFAKSERVWYLDAFIAIYDLFFGANKPEDNAKVGFTSLVHWTEAAELYIEREKFNEAMGCLFDVGQAYKKKGEPYEYVRVAKILFNSIDWSNHRNLRGFDDVFNNYFDMLAVMGRNDECNLLLERYRETVPKKDARYINFCDVNCYFHWLNENYLTSIRWGAEGVDLKNKSGADTTFDCSHNLALAQRDSGAIDPALSFFLKSKKLEDVLDPEEFDQGRGGSYYGNIGRCLQLMGQTDSALVCYKKSAISIERVLDTDHLANQGYIRQWVGEVLIARGDEGEGLKFLAAAFGLWRFTSPPKAGRVRAKLEAADVDIGERALIEAENFARSWIFKSD